MVTNHDTLLLSNYCTRVCVCVCSVCPKKGDKLKVDKRVGFYHTKNNGKKCAINRDILNVKNCVCVPIFVRKWTEYFINSFFFCVILAMVPFQFALCVGKVH